MKEIVATSAADVDRAASRAEIDPSDGRKKAGNYRMGHTKINDLRIAIETPGMVPGARKGKTADGMPWQSTLFTHYGYVKGTEGADGDAVDVFLGPDTDSQKVFVIDQIDLGTGKFDEHKCMLGFNHEGDAIFAYDASYHDGRAKERRRDVVEMSMQEFKTWLADKRATRFPAKQWKAGSGQMRSILRMAGDVMARIESHKTFKPALPGSGLAKAEFTGPRLWDESRVIRDQNGRFFVWIGEPELAKAASKQEKDIEDQLATGVARLLNWFQTAGAEKAIEAVNDDQDAVAAAVPKAENTKSFLDALKSIDTAFVGGAKKAVNQNEPPGGSRDKVVAFSFDAGNRRVNEALNNYKLSLIQDITETQEETIRAVVASAIRDGLGPDETARRIRETIGLTVNQANHVLNYRQELENLNVGALMRDLRDKRFDGVVTSAIENGSPLSTEQVDKMVDAYKRRYVAYRATTIARTESLRAVTLGRVAGVEAVMNSDPDGEYTVIKTWVATKDGKTRDTHRNLDGQSVEGMDSPFVTTAGNELRFPHDPDAPASETINCRCSIRFRLVRKDRQQEMFQEDE